MRKLKTAEATSPAQGYPGSFWLAESGMLFSYRPALFAWCHTVCSQNFNLLDSLVPCKRPDSIWNYSEFKIPAPISKSNWFAIEWNLKWMTWDQYLLMERERDKQSSKTDSVSQNRLWVTGSKVWREDHTVCRSVLKVVTTLYLGGKIYFHIANCRK